MPAGRLTELDQREILHYLGWRGAEPDGQMLEGLRRAKEDVVRHATPLVTWRRFPVRGGRVEGTRLTLEGQDILRHLEGCREAILMAATLGPRLENALMRMEVLDMAQALLMDSCASAAIENVCDNLEGDLREDLAREGLFLTHRFSPGYGDLPIGHQKLFCEVLDTARRIGLTVSESGILLPRKSVTAILGISPTPVPRRSSGCGQCRLFYTCQLRRNGNVCSAQKTPHPETGKKVIL